MNWSQKFPNVGIDQYSPDGYRLRTGVIGKCFMCDKRTSWLDLCFEGRLCSEECEEEVFNDIDRRSRQQDAASHIKLF